jgi:hypothetical protein
MFVGVLLVLAALIGGIVLLLAGGGEDESDEAPPQEVAELQEQILRRTVVDPQHGISVRRPNDWSQAKTSGVITLRSQNRCVVVNLSAPAGPNQSAKLLDDSIAALRDSFRGVRTGAVSQRQLGGIPTQSRTVSYRSEGGDEIRLQANAGKGEKYTYLTSVLLGNPACSRDLAVAELILSSIQYTK